MANNAILSIQVQDKEKGTVPVTMYVTEGDKGELVGMAKQFIHNVTKDKSNMGQGAPAPAPTEPEKIVHGSSSGRITGYMTEAGAKIMGAKSTNIVKPATEAKPHLKTLNKGSSAFVVYRCPHCMKLIMTVGSIGAEVECRNCHSKSKVPDELIHTEYKCSACNTVGFLFMEKGATDNIGCKKCHSPIDLFFIEKKGHYESAGVKGR